MKKIIVAVFLIAFLPTISMAQKHAPRPYIKKVARGIYPEGSTRLLRETDVEGLTSWDLKVMRNEIFARHGYIFKTDDMTAYFSQKSWYTPIYDDVTFLLTPIEKKNIAFIKRYE
jgi:hypothetical protein